MLYVGIILVIFAVLAMVIVFTWLRDKRTYNDSQNDAIGVITMLICVLCIVGSILSFNTFKRNLITSAIEHYQVGDYELVEKRVNELTISSYYKIVDPDND